MRKWVSREQCKGYYFGFEKHPRKKEATILKCKDDKVTYVLVFSDDEYFGENIFTLPIDTFIKVYEPLQESMYFIHSQRNNVEEKIYTNSELEVIVRSVQPSRVVG